MPQSIVPTFQIKVNGSPLKEQPAADVLSVSVHEDVGAPGMFTLRLSNWDMFQLKMTWSDDRLFDIGGKVEIQMGYVDKLKKLFVGEITALEPEFTASEAPILVVRGYDLRHRLLRGRKTRSFVKIKDSAIASQVAQAVGLKASVVDSKVQLEYVLQHNQTDMEFLQERARRIGYELAIEDETLLFRPAQIDKSTKVVLERNKDLLEFYPRLTSMFQVSGVEVRGWDPKKKEAIVGKAAVGSEGKLLGTKGGPSTVKGAFGTASAVEVSDPVFSKAEADSMAKGQFGAVALDYIEGDGVCVGRTDVRAGTLIQIAGLGKRFSGNYYVTTTTHSYDPERGYRTGFTVRRNAA